MSDNSSNSNPTNAPATAPAQANGDITGEEAKALVEAAKAQGKPVQDLIAGKSEPKAPESNKEAIKDAAAEAIRRFKVKVDGAELEVDENELLRGYSHQKAANKQLQEGKAAKKQAEEFISMMKDPQKLFEVIQKLGHDPRMLSEKYLASQLEDEMMDPRDRELRDTKNKLRQIEDMERMQKEHVEKQRLNDLKAKYSQEYETQFVDALKGSGLPPTKAMVGEMAKYISQSAKIGFKMTPGEAAQLVKEDIQRSQLALYGNADGETLLKLLGDEAASKILSARGSKPRNPEQNLKTPVTQGEPSERVKRNENKRMNAREWREFNKRK
jgi:CRP-like cAMP-binding protein